MGASTLEIPLDPPLAKGEENDQNCPTISPYHKEVNKVLPFSKGETEGIFRNF